MPLGWAKADKTHFWNKGDLTNQVHVKTWRLIGTRRKEEDFYL